MEHFSHLTNDELAAEITTWSGRIAAGEAHLISLIDEFDRREAWGGPGLLSCAHWLTWSTGLGLTAARERVRVAGRLAELPEVEAAFSAGGMSWSQVRAVTRVAAVDDGVDWVDLARHASGSQLERICRGMRRVHKLAEGEADPELAAYRMRTRKRYDEDGNVVITIYANAEDGAVIDAGLGAVIADLERARAAATDDSAESSESDAPEETALRLVDDSAESLLAAPEPVRVTEADALLEMARRALEAQQAERPDVARRNRSALTAQVDPLSGWGRLKDGELLPPTSLTAALKSLPGRGGQLRVRPLTSADLTRLDLGRTVRDVSLPLRELLGTLDGERCRFPACTRRRKLHAHHVMYLVGRRLDRPGEPGAAVQSAPHPRAPAGIPTHVAPRPASRGQDQRRRASAAPPRVPWGNLAGLDPTGHITADTLPATHCDGRMDYRYVVSVLVQQAA
jgi:hypothetical protein